MPEDRQTTARRSGTGPGVAHAERREAVRVRLLGGFSVCVGEREVGRDAWRLRKAANLVKLLALSPRRRMHRERVMDLLWPDLGARAQANNLRQTLHAARKAFGPDGEGARCLVLSGDQICLCPGEPSWTDVTAFEEAAANARRTREPDAYRSAIRLYAGDLLPEDLYEGWAEERREILKSTFLALLDDLAGLHEERGEHAMSIRVSERLVAAESLREEAHARLMRLYALEGKRAEALGQFDRLHQALAKDLGIEPGGEIVRLRERILSGEFPPAGSGHHPGPAIRGERQSDLPAVRTSFVGRERELDEACRSLAMTRLLTLTGPGGAGKTRLALELVGEVAGSYPDGTKVVELAPLSEEGLVEHAVARSFDLREKPGRPLSETIADFLSKKEALLLLDNCEHLVGAAARLVDDLLDSCPRLRVLVTSREPLGVAGEVVRPVPPLSVPAGDQGVEEMYGHEAVRLFVERAANRNPAFSLTSENAAAVASICRGLDGIPLAIELAAARVGSLSAAQISARLDDSLRLLTGGVRTATPRQRTMRGALDWSHDLLDEPEKRLFARLSVFAGGFSLAAAEAVGDDAEDVLDLLSMLADRSLVLVAGWRGEEARYRLLEPVRQYAREKLEAAVGDAGRREFEEVGEWHAAYYLRLAEETGNEPGGLRNVGRMDGLKREHDNIRAALRWLLERGDAGRALRLSAAMGEFWRIRGHLREGLGWLENALELEGGPPLARIVTLNHAGWISWEMVDFEASSGFSREALDRSRALGDRRGAAVALYHLGMVAIYHRMEAGKARKLFEESLALRRELGDDVGAGRTLQKIGLISVVEGDFARAQALYEESLKLASETEDGIGHSLALWLGALAALGRGEYGRAEELCVTGIHVARQVGYAHAVALLINVLAASAGASGHPLRSARLWGASEMLLDAAGYGLGPAELHHYAPYTAAARAALGDDEAWEAALTAGRSMKPDEAVRHALRKEETTQPAGAFGTASAVSLTRREEEIAVLVARGFTNRRIAAELTISQRTAANHVASVLKKLGLRSRVEVADRLRDPTLQRPP